MTKKKARVIRPYTNNAAVSALAGFDEPLRTKVLKTFFDEENHQSISDGIHEAITTYYLHRKTNPDRKGAQKQRHDRQQLVECLKELRIRLSPLHIPLPLLSAVRSRYNLLEPGRPSLDDEMRDLMLRLRYLETLFDETQIPGRNRTNPGKPERNQLITELGVIFDDYTSYNDERQRTRDKKKFLREVFQTFHLPAPPR